MIDWSQTYIKYSKQVRRMCVHILGYEHLAVDDAVSDAFMKGMLKESQYKPELSAINTWLCEIARNNCFEILKKEKNNAPMLVDFPMDDVEEDIIGTMHDRIKEIMNEMPESKNKTTYLAVLNGMTHAQASNHFDIRMNTVRTRIKRFLDDVRKKTKDEPMFKDLNSRKNKKKKFGWTSPTVNKVILKKREQKLNSYT